MTTKPPADGGPAFPVPMIPSDRQGGYSGVQETGMTLRDYFAGQALDACMREADEWYRSGNPCDVLQRAAVGAYRLADAMLAARAALATAKQTQGEHK